MKKIWRLTILISIAIVLAILYWYFYIYNPETQIAYWPNGQIRHIYHNAYGGVLHGEQIDYYENGQIYRIMHFKDGQQHGEYISYYENGQIADIRHFDHSESVGELISYRPTGELIGKWNYVDGLPVDGEYIERYENGDIRRKVTYKDGKVDGYDIRYDRNGDISFKYDADWNTVYNKNDEGNTVEEPEELIENNEDSISCNDIDLNLNTKYTYIDNVVENCTYEEGTAYSWNGGGCGGVMPHLYITKDIIGYFDIVADEDHPIICKSPRAGIIKSLSGDFEDLATFWYKHGITKKALIDTLEARTDEEVFRNECGYYFCNGDICEQFYRPSYGENDNHYYIYGYRYPVNGPYETVLLVDDKLYMLGQSENMFDEDYRPNPVKQGRWVVYGLDGDKLIVKRYVDGELIPPYTLENFNSYNFDEPTTTTKFKVKTCEIPL